MILFFIPWCIPVVFGLIIYYIRFSVVVFVIIFHFTVHQNRISISNWRTTNQFIILMNNEQLEVWNGISISKKCLIVWTCPSSIVVVDIRGRTIWYLNGDEIYITNLLHLIQKQIRDIAQFDTQRSKHILTVCDWINYVFDFRKLFSSLRVSDTSERTNGTKYHHRKSLKRSKQFDTCPNAKCRVQRVNSCESICYNILLFLKAFLICILNDAKAKENL